MWAVTVSFSSAVCGFSSFWLTVFSKRRSFTVSQYRSFVLSSLIIQFNRACDTKHSRLFLGQHKMITQFLTVNLCLNCCCMPWPGFSICVSINLRSSHIFSQWLRLISWAYLLEISKREMDTTLRKRDWSEM